MALKVTDAEARKLVRRDVGELAPKMRAAVEAAAAECEAAGFPVYVYECLRSHALAKMYFYLGVSRAQDGFKTWHFYGLAVDVIHPRTAWDAWEHDAAWRSNVVRIFKARGLDWGGDWQGFRDLPHFQWGQCKPSPSKEAIRLYEAAGEGLAGREAVWSAVGAASDA